MFGSIVGEVMAHVIAGLGFKRDGAAWVNETAGVRLEKQGASSYRLERLRDGKAAHVSTNKRKSAAIAEDLSGKLQNAFFTLTAGE